MFVDSLLECNSCAMSTMQGQNGKRPLTVGYKAHVNYNTEHSHGLMNFSHGLCRKLKETKKVSK